MQWTDGSIATGKPGVHLAANAGIYRVDLGPLDRIAPNAVSGATISYSAQPTRVDATWTVASDDANGTGVWKYSIYRNSAWIQDATSPAFTDLGVQPGTLYTYGIVTRDFHNNESATTTFNVLTPGTGGGPVSSPARLGVRPTGAYWGAGGESIDMLSGNLNFSMPLVNAEGRGGATTRRPGAKTRAASGRSGGMWATASAGG